MTTVIFQSLGAAVGGAIAGPTGAAIGSAIGALAGAYVDQQLFGPDDRTIVGRRAWRAHKFCPRVKGQQFPGFTGDSGISGEIIWATRFVEVQSVETQSQGGQRRWFQNAGSVLQLLCQFRRLDYAKERSRRRGESGPMGSRSSSRCIRSVRTRAMRPSSQTV